jgi:hypothetical protein
VLANGFSGGHEKLAVLFRKSESRELGLRTGNQIAVEGDLDRFVVADGFESFADGGVGVSAKMDERKCANH